jgi:hypothetical protein
MKFPVMPCTSINDDNIYCIEITRPWPINIYRTEMGLEVRSDIEYYEVGGYFDSGDKTMLVEYVDLERGWWGRSRP